MTTKRKLKPRPTYRAHDQADYDREISVVFAPGTILYDMAVEEVMQENFGVTDKEFFMIEGARRVFIRFINTGVNKGAADVTSGSS